MVAIMPSLKNNELADSSGYMKMLIQLMAEKGVIKKSQVEQGLSKLLTHSVDNDFAPPPARFVSWCLPDCDLPSREQAYLDACASNWSHVAVYESVKIVTSWALRTRPEKEMRPFFYSVYKNVCAKIQGGHVYPEPMAAERGLPAMDKSEEEKRVISEQAEQARAEFYKLRDNL